MKKLIPIIFVVVLLTIAAVVCGVLVAKNLSPQVITPVETSNQGPVNTNQPIVIPLPTYDKPKPEVSLIATGDLMLSRSVEQLLVKKNDFILPFKPLEKITSAADITLGNLETAILAGRPIMAGELNFRVDPAAIAGLKLAGFDLVSLANNHTPNFGQAGLESTFSELEKNQISYIGAGRNLVEAQKPVIIEKQGIKFGFLAYVSSDLPKSYQATENQPGVNFMNLDQLKTDIANLKPQVDFVIVSMHGGVEYDTKPSQHQIEFAHTAIDAGASLVLGHHPHVVQTFEKYGNGYVIYSLGNFIFDQIWSADAQQGVAAKIVFSPQEIKNIEFIPLKINTNFQPELADDKTSQNIINRLAQPIFSQPRFFWNGKEYQETTSWQINLSSSPISPKVRFANRTFGAADLDSDGQPEEAVIVGQVGYLIKNDKVLWQSDKNWQLDNVLIGDFNNDGKIEVGFSLWKEGSFGPDLPFWEEENDKNISNHLFLYQFVETHNIASLQMIWGSSALDQPIREMALADLDGDSKNELVVLEDTNSVGAIRESHLRNLSIWRFNEWNFVNFYKSRQGKFFDLKTDLNYIYLREE
ncbi:MAG: CapA family protein [Patescibacteria group bacterium]|jgi:poly-gamma-glutamate synthesis protein (capsule biosynthesis protein)